MSWMKLNEGLSSLKGQISTFASNVLADEEDSEVKTSDFEELKQLCVQQKLEIDNLKTINEKLQNASQLHQIQQNGAVSSDGSWNWESQDARPIVIDNGDTISDLKKRVTELENERNDVMSQLDQLDAENQENLSKVVAMKEKLQEELSDLQEDYQKLKGDKRSLIAKEEELTKQLKELQRNQNINSDDSKQVENQKLKAALEEMRKKLKVAENSNETLQKVFEDLKVASDTENSKNMERVNRIEGENKILASLLQNAEEKIRVFEKKSVEDEENCQKLAVILETYEKQVRTLREETELLKTQNQCSRVEETENRLKSVTAELEELKSQKERAAEETNSLQDSQNIIQGLRMENSDLRSQNENLQLQVNSRMDVDLEEELEHIKAEHSAQLTLLEQEVEQLRIDEGKRATDEEQIQELEDCIKTLRIEIGDLEEQNKELAAIHEKVMIELHDQYVSIITENIKKFQDCEKPSDFQHCFYEDDPQVADFSKQVENIMKILLDLKCKCQTLENKVMELSEEKNSILAEKNHEIEKLIHNSEILSQEVLSKTKAIKEFEKECSDLAGNNDLLIADLEAYKNNSVLQTISESNEDNMVLLESQLENANMRIEDLERIIDDYDKEKQERNISMQKHDMVRQLKSTGHEISKKTKDYQELLNSYDQLQIEHDTLKSDLEASRDYLQVINHDNCELKTSLEKVTSDYDNLEYQISEMNVNNDSLKEEILLSKNQIDNLLKENSKLMFLSEEYNETNEELKSRLSFLEKKLVEDENERSGLESQVRLLTEKLQMSKMAETSLKLHCEQKSKEVATLSEAKNNLEVSLNQANADLIQLQMKFADLQSLNEKLSSNFEELKKTDMMRQEQITDFEKLVKDLNEKLQEYEKLALEENQKQSVTDDVANIGNEKQPDDKPVPTNNNEMIDNIEDIKVQLENITVERNNLKAELDKLSQVETELTEAQNRCNVLEHMFSETKRSNDELIHLVTAKHEENLTYHNEIQRLNQILTTETEKYRQLQTHLNELKSKMSSENLDTMKADMEKSKDQNAFLKEKCEVMAKNLLEEQSKVQQLMTGKSEKETALQKKLDRLQAHLVESEEHYTQELLQAEQKNAALQAKMADIEEREKSSSTMYTSVSIRANQQVESLQKQLQAVTSERNGLRKQISDAEDQNNKQAAALANLQFVLEHFRKDKEKDVHIETERIRRQIGVERQVQDELRKEIASLKTQLDESNQGLQAASRLSDQLENSKKLVSTLRDEVSQLQSKLSRADEELKAASSQTNEKVDKSLVKNLIIGFVTSNNNLNKDQTQILRIIATVLDFNQQDHDKVSLNKPQTGSWLGSFLAPDPSKFSAESLSQAFVRFLENESRPRAVPNLLSASGEAESSAQPTPRQSPIVLSEVVLPTFADFAQNRNSSSILKDVLKDNS